jgi:U3 small nucleolar RNA-associated protein 4
VYQWSVDSLTPVAVSDSFGGVVWDLCISADKNLLVAACEDGTLRVFDLSSGSLVYRKSVAGSDTRIMCCAFHPSQHLVACGDSRGRMEVWDLSKGLQVSRVKVSGGDIEASVEVVCFVEDNVVVTGDFIGYTQFWDVATQTLMHSYRSHSSCIQTMLLAGPHLFVSGVDPKVVRFAKLYNQWSPSLTSSSHEHPVTGLAYSNHTLISCGMD